MLYIQRPLDDIYKMHDKKEKVSKKETEMQKKLRKLKKIIKKGRIYLA